MIEPTVTADNEAMIGGEIMRTLRAILEAKLKKTPNASYVKHEDWRCRAVWLLGMEPTLYMDVYLLPIPGDEPRAVRIYHAVVTRLVVPSDLRLAATLADHVPSLMAALDALK